MLHEHADRRRLRSRIAHAYLPVARRPFLIERHGCDVSGRDIAFGATLGDKTHAQAGLDHAADRLEAVDAYPRHDRYFSCNPWISHVFPSLPCVSFHSFERRRYPLAAVE